MTYLPDGMGDGEVCTGVTSFRVLVALDRPNLPRVARREMA